MNSPSDQIQTSNDQSKSTAKRSEIWTDFYENSTLHGLRNVFASEYRYKRIIWLVLLLGGAGYLIYSMVNSVDRFFQYPTIIEVNEGGTKKSLPFPAITICPMNYLDNYKVHALDGDQVFDGYKLNISACAATANIRGGAPCGHALICAFMDHPAAYAHQWLPNCTDEYKHAISETLTQANITFDRMEFLRSFSESWQEILTYCFFGFMQNNCADLRHFKLVLHPQYGGLCYTFNDGTYQDPPIQSDSAGRQGAVTFLLKHRPERYFYPIYTEGYDVFIHDQQTGLGETQVSTSNGKRTSIAIQRNKIISLEKSEGGKCERRTLKGFKKYTHLDCEFECLSNATKVSCGCRPAQPGDYDDSITCYSVHANCTYKLEHNFEYNDCPCPLSCDETIFKTSTSYGLLPSSSTPGVKLIYGLPDYSAEKYVAVSVYYSSHRNTTLRQKRTFGPTSLLGEIGGNMGLLLGCSLMTVVEFIFLLVSLIASFFKPKGEVKDTASQTQA